jgi:hypothetical protein
MWIKMPPTSDMSWMCLKMSLVGLLQLLPFHQPSTTPLLSPKTLMWVRLGAEGVRVRMRKRKLTASAHPMSLLLAFQPGRSLHALHLFPIVIPMPVSELASEEVFTIPHEFWWNSEDSESNVRVHRIPLEFSWLEPQPFQFPIPWTFRQNPPESGGMVGIREPPRTVSVGIHWNSDWIPWDSVRIPKECSDFTCYFNIKNNGMSKD